MVTTVGGIDNSFLSVLKFKNQWNIIRLTKSLSLRQYVKN